MTKVLDFSSQYFSRIGKFKQNWQNQPSVAYKSVALKRSVYTFTAAGASGNPGPLEPEFHGAFHGPLHVRQDGQTYSILDYQGMRVDIVDAGYDLKNVIRRCLIFCFFYRLNSVQKIPYR